MLSCYRHCLSITAKKKRITADIGWVDSTTISIHYHGSGALKKRPQAIGRGRKGVGTKIHVGLSATKMQEACLSAANQVNIHIFYFRESSQLA